MDFLDTKLMIRNILCHGLLIYTFLLSNSGIDVLCNKINEVTIYDNIIYNVFTDNLLKAHKILQVKVYCFLIPDSSIKRKVLMLI